MKSDMKKMGMALVITGIVLIVSTWIVYWRLSRGQSIQIQSLQKEKEDLEAEVVRCKEKEEFIDGQVEKMKETLFEIAENNDLDKERLADLNLANEQLRIAIDESDSVNRGRSEFLAHVSREIESPVRAIIGLTDLTLNTQLTPEQGKNISTIKESAHSILCLIDSLSDLLHIDAREMELQKRHFNIESVMDSVIATLYPYAEKKGLDLQYRFNDRLSPNLYGDEVRLRQILIHLVSNAIKYTQRGKVMVNIEKVLLGHNEATAENQDAYTVFLHFSVSDTGTGISEDTLGRILDSFNQTDGSVVRKSNETGLGLSITSKLVHMMGGEIWVESKVGDGSTFHFTAAFAAYPELKHQTPLPHCTEAGESAVES